MDPNTQQAPQYQEADAKNRFDPNFTAAVINAIGPNVPDRTRFVMSSLITHLHDFIREVELTNEEWFDGVRFVNLIGKTTTNTRNEAHRISDVLGVESYVLGYLALSGTWLTVQQTSRRDRAQAYQRVWRSPYLLHNSGTLLVASLPIPRPRRHHHSQPPPRWPDFAYARCGHGSRHQEGHSRRGH
jgi:hypothetical protein